jgi:hypothetical protein
VLLIILAVLVPILAAALWLSAVILQGWLYNDLANRLPLRALGGGAVLALFLTGWCAIYKADPGRFDTLFNFKTEALDSTVTEFQSVRKVGKEEKKPVKYARGGAGSEFASAETGKVWKRSDADGMVVAILIPPKDGKGEPTRFNAQLQPDGTFPAGGVRFQEEKGPRYTDEASLGQVYRVRSFAVIGNLFANFLHAALWAVVLWLGMRFAFGHAVGIGLAFWAVTMIALQPALFKYVAPNA